MTTLMRPVTGFLFARPSWIEGLARLFDFGNTLQEYNVMPSGREADEMALRMDWHIVGAAMYDALEEAKAGSLRPE